MLLLAWGSAQGTTPNPRLILVAILASSRVSPSRSAGHVGAVLELFPNPWGVAISFVGAGQLRDRLPGDPVFPWQLQSLGSATTFLLYALVSRSGAGFVLRVLAETKAARSRSSQRCSSELRWMSVMRLPLAANAATRPQHGHR